MITMLSLMALMAHVGWLGPLVAAAFAGRATSVRRARSVAILGMLVGTLAAFSGLLALGMPGSALVGSPVPYGLPVFVSLIGLTAISLSPSRGMRPASFARILLVSACTVAFIQAERPALLGVLWCLTSVPVWLELRSRPDTRAAARVFAWYMVPSALLVFIGSLMQATGATTGALLIMAGIAIREATVPFHSWLPHFVQRAPLGLVVVLVAPQLGVYAHLRLLADTSPPELTNIVASLGIVTVLFAGAMGAVQRDARRSLGYLMMSQTGLVAFGLETGGGLGRTGALVTWLVSGLALAGLAMSIAALEARRGPLDLDHPAGSFRHIPHMAASFLLLGLASVGLPGTLGFVAEDLLVQGSVDRFPVLGLALIVGTALNSITVLRAFFALFTGSRRDSGERDLRPRERIVLSVLTATLVLTGLWPDAIVGSHGVAGHLAEQHAQGE